MNLNNFYSVSNSDLINLNMLENLERYLKKISVSNPNSARKIRSVLDLLHDFEMD